jgi:antitoxin (DNA-binding transcriptional repressor) of toxin-antitoxin stability system
MSSHSVAEAKERFPELVELALRGEPAMFTRDGKRVAESRPVVAAAETGPVVTAESLAWLDRVRVGRLDPDAPDADTLVSRMRDEEWDWGTMPMPACSFRCSPSMPSPRGQGPGWPTPHAASS